jgi:guanylate kinase
LGEYDYVVINDDVDECFFDRVLEVLDAEEMRRTRKGWADPFVRELMG